MPEPTRGDVWVFHAGALGDAVLVWPLLRALGARHGGATVHLVADAEKARLAARCIPGVVAHDMQQRRFTRLWTGDAPAPGDVVHDAPRVLNFVADPTTSPAWMAAASAMFPRADVRFVGGPGDPSRAVVWRQEQVQRLGSVASRSNPDGPVVCHVGAGSPAKRWPLARWAELLKGTHELWVVLAGEVEAERLTPDERRVFRAIGGRVCGSLDELATTLVAARVFVGADTGPTHLAAQLGVPTLALFGPTEPGVWAPVGPRVAVLAPWRPCGMEWLDVEDVRSALASLQT